jgi:hypothetical protein
VEYQQSAGKYQPPSLTTATDLLYAKWTAYVRRRFALEALFVNHEILMTGRITLLLGEGGPGRELRYSTPG